MMNMSGTTDRVGDMGERVFLFVDGSNLFGSIREMSRKLGTRIGIDYERFFRFLAGSRRLLRVYFYTSLPPQESNPEAYKQQVDFIYAVRQRANERGVNLKIRQAFRQPRSYGFIEKGTDVKLAADLLSLAFHDAFDIAVLVSGDSDFVEVVEEVQRLGKIVENAVFRANSSEALRDTCDRYIYLDDHLEEFQLERGREAPAPTSEQEDIVPAEQV
jgi:uncharacterized LabA/DUF88 family protein